MQDHFHAGNGFPEQHDAMDHTSADHVGQVHCDFYNLIYVTYSLQVSRGHNIKSVANFDKCIEI